MIKLRNKYHPTSRLPEDTEPQTKRTSKYFILNGQLTERANQNKTMHISNAKN